MREQQLSAAQQRSSSHSLQIIAPKPPVIGYHQPATHQFSHFYPSQAGPIPPQLPVNLAPNQFLSQPQPSKFTFFPPTTIDAFSQGNGRQDVPGGSCHGASRAAQDGRPEGQTSASQYPRKQATGTSSVAEADSTVPISEEQHDDWDYEFYDDDESMAESDDEFLPEFSNSQSGLDGPGVVTSQKLDYQYHMLGTNTRTFSTFGAETVLATYDPAPSNSPLTDKHIAAVFWHFINVTGPSMSIYERHPLDPSNVFRGQMTTSKQHGWSCKRVPILSGRSPH